MKIIAAEIQQLFPLFEPELVQDIVAEAETKTFNEGEFILQRGQYMRSMLLVVDGLVKVFRTNGNGSNFFMHYLSRGDAFVSTMLNDNVQQPSEMVAVAFKKTVLLVVPLSCMDKWMLKYKSWYAFVFEAFKKRVGALFDAIDNLAFLNTNERLIHYLKNHQRVLKSKNIPITRTDIAREMNSSREVITRLLKKLATKGKIKMHRQYVEIIDLE